MYIPPSHSRILPYLEAALAEAPVAAAVDSTHLAAEVRDREACVYGCGTPVLEVCLTAIVAFFPVSRHSGMSGQ